MNLLGIEKFCQREGEMLGVLCGLVARRLESLDTRRRLISDRQYEAPAGLGEILPRTDNLERFTNGR